MTDAAHASRDALPMWMTPQRVTSAEKNEAALSWHDESDPRFQVSIPKLRELLESGYVATPRYYFKVVGDALGDTGFNAWCRKLGRDLHELVAQHVDDTIAAELEPLSRDIGNVMSWTQGFESIFPYLDAIERRTDIDVTTLTVVGRPGRPLLDAARGLALEAEPSGTHSALRREGNVDRVHRLLQQEKNVVVEGVAGSGKSHLLGGLTSLYSHVEVVVFHPSTSYEEFVSGLRPTQKGAFEGVAGTFVQACERAAQDPETQHLLFIDEINRANTSKVFGDLLLPIEKSKRADVHRLDGRALFVNAPDDTTSVTLQTPIGRDGCNRLVVPDNLHVLGTMNSTDRSVGTIDLALRRRFTWFSMEPLTAEALLQDTDFQSKKDGESAAAQEDWDQVVEWFGETNETLLTQIGPDARLGHAYVFGASSPLAAARSLVTQLAEIAFTFNLAPETLDEMPAVELRGEALSLNATYRGQGLGRRPSVVIQRLSPTEVIPGSSA
ncbi:MULTISPECIES: McrB family protein [Clavibacter]|uniref:AAA+ ATPase domain-containing protein n=2 Tax=Clavibacter TaxID=1573 RepID=A0A399NWM6_9MICO|nr:MULTISPECIES: AAA family ATPase [Clavibacter]RII98187.1 hypothetical protein DZF96_04130 [Clavibacter michiganensis]UKF24350.1 AAA family ATPase [Clavibacter sp. A6099]